jgi:hypothetical protein
MFLLVVGCAKNVGNQIGVVKSDQDRFAAMLSIAPVESPSVLAKASSVSSSASYGGSDSQRMLERSLAAVKELGYSLDRTPSSTDGLLYRICHPVEPGRSVLIRRESGLLNVTFHISGWKRDREECPGR